MHTLGGANGRGIEFNMNGNDISDKSGCQCYGNIVSNMPDVGYRCNWNRYQVVFYNNVANNCDTSFWFQHDFQSPGLNIKMRNNISLNPITRHIYFQSFSGANAPILDSDYNIFYPTSGSLFWFWTNSVGGSKTFTEWQVLSHAGCTFDPHSWAGNPLSMLQMAIFIFCLLLPL